MKCYKVFKLRKGVYNVLFKLFNFLFSRIFFISIDEVYSYIYMGCFIFLVNLLINNCKSL